MVIHILTDIHRDILSLLIYIFVVGNKVYEFLLTEHYIFITNQVKLANTVGQNQQNQLLWGRQEAHALKITNPSIIPALHT